MSLRLSVFISLLSVTGRSDHVEDFRALGPGVAHAVRGRAAVVHAVTCVELVDVGTELEVHPAFNDEQELLGVTVRVRLVAGRSTWVELGGDDLERVKGLGSEQRLATEVAPDDRLARLPSKHRRARETVAREEIGDLDAQGS